MAISHALLDRGQELAVRLETRSSKLHLDLAEDIGRERRRDLGATTTAVP